MDAVSSLLQAMGDCRALDAVQLEEARRDLLPRFAGDARGLAHALLKRQWLTAFQINRLNAGRGAELLLGSYVLLERLGEGGMGQVFKARNWKLGQVVALKLIRKDLLANKTVVGRFEREVAATAQLHHPNIIRAFDADRTDDGLFIVMEYVEGIDLCRLVKEQGPVPPAKACDYICQAARGLQHAHEKGFIHRDIKPPNLLVDGQGVVKVLDLGLARARESADLLRQPEQLALTQFGVIVGTVDFIAPEQARDSRSVDIRADLYALGCTFCYLLTGKPPFPGGTPTEKLLKHSLDPLPALADVPVAIRAIIHKLMAKKPADRYQTPADLVEALEELLARPEKLRPRLAELLPVTVPTLEMPRPGPAPKATLVGATYSSSGPHATMRAPVAQLVSVAEALKAEPGHSVSRPTPPPRAPLSLLLEDVPHAVPVTPAQRRRRWPWVAAAAGLVAAIVAFPLLSPAPKSSGDESQQTPPAPEIQPRKGWDGVVREFLILGPFDRDSTVPAQVLKNPSPAASYDVFAGKVTWRSQKVEASGALKLPAGTARRPAILLATMQVYSPSAQQVKLHCGAAETVRIRVNGRSLLDSGKSYPQPRPDDHQLALSLKAGWNLVLVRLEARTVRPFEFYLSFKGEDGLRAALRP